MPDAKYYLSWADFDAAVLTLVQKITVRFSDLRDCEVYGVQRGGLPLAVALSHRLDLPVISDLACRRGRVLVVDDVVETGLTARQYDVIGGLFWCWVNKNPDFDATRAVLSLPSTTWVVFPWENRDHADSDAADYYTRRS